MELSNSPSGVKRRLKIVGFYEWDDEEKFLIFRAFVESVDAQGNLLTDKVFDQRREVRYPLTNLNRVNAQFNPVASGGIGEYDFFMVLINTSPPTQTMPQILLQLAQKLNERGLFN